MFFAPVSSVSRVMNPARAASFERLLDDTLASVFGHAAAHAADPANATEAPRSPALDVSESATAFMVKLDMPGVKKEDVKVTVEGKRVSVSAQALTAAQASTETAGQTSAPESGQIVWRERRAASFARQFTLPAEVEQATAVAKLEDAVLKLELPKRSHAVAAQITIN